MQDGSFFDFIQKIANLGKIRIKKAVIYDG
jgi:hypothetical protein